MKRTNTLILTVLFLAASMAMPSRANADCAIFSGMGWGSLAGLGLGAIVGGIAGGKAVESTSNSDVDVSGNQSVSTGAKVLGAVVFGIIGSAVGAVVGLGTGAVMCLVEDQNSLPVYAQDDFVPVVTADPLILANGTTLVEQIEAATARQPALLFRQATLLDPNALPAY